MYDDVYIYIHVHRKYLHMTEISGEASTRYAISAGNLLRNYNVSRYMSIMIVHVTLGGHYRNYQCGTRSFSEDTGNHLEIGYT